MCRTAPGPASAAAAARRTTPPSNVADVTSDGSNPLTLPATLARRVAEGDERFAVVGATGWFGRTTLELLIRALGPAAFRARVTGWASWARTVTLPGGEPLDVGGLADLAAAASRPTHLLHYAAATREQVDRLGHADYLDTCLTISTHVHRALVDLCPEAFLYTSSGAAYGRRRDGRLDTNLAENPYGVLKHLDELAFRQACRDQSTRSVVVRVFAVSGPHINKPEVYALADLLQQALTQDRLVVRATRPVWRSYTAVRDVVALSLAALVDPEQRDLVLETGGVRTEVGELADRVRRLVDRPDLPVHRQLDPDAPADEYVGDGRRMEELAALYGVDLTDLDDQIRATAGHVLPVRPGEAAGG